MAHPLMPKATAVWLIDNTTLTFDQIAAFCGLHKLEVEGIADGKVATDIIGLDPVANGQLTRDEIARCEADPNAQMKMKATDTPLTSARRKGPRYTPVSKRQDRPDAIAWLLKYHPEITDARIAKLLGTTKATIEAVRSRTHWNASNIKPRDPVLLGLCTQTDLEIEVQKAAARRPKTEPEPEPEPAAATVEDPPA